MATPEAPRGPEQSLSRVVNKGTPGQAGGRMTGLSPVPRGIQRARRAAPTSGAGYLGYYSASGTIVPTSGVDNALTPTSESDDLVGPTASMVTGGVDAGSEGLWSCQLRVNENLIGSAAAGILRLTSDEAGSNSCPLFQLSDGSVEARVQLGPLYTFQGFRGVLYYEGPASSFGFTYVLRPILLP
jgi:hypothetical protein